jgi:hypothetical protein
MPTLEHAQLPAPTGTVSRRRDGVAPLFAIAGAWLQLKGWWMVRRGRARRDDVACALGWRLQLLGMHQRWGREDRGAVEARLDGWFIRNAARLLRAPAPVPTPALDPSFHP